MASLREKKKRRVRADILAAAAGRIDTEGYRNANMRDIAAEAEVAYQTLYNYFPSKAHLGLALIAKDLAEPTDPGQEASDDPVAAIEELARSGMAFVNQYDRELWREVIAQTIRSAGGSRSARGSVADQVDPKIGERVRVLLDNARQRGDLDAYLDTDALAEVIESLIESAFLNLILDDGQDPQAAAGDVARRIALVVDPHRRGTV